METVKTNNGDDDVELETAELNKDDEDVIVETAELLTMMTLKSQNWHYFSGDCKNK